MFLLTNQSVKKKEKGLEYLEINNYSTYLKLVLCWFLLLKVFRKEKELEYLEINNYSTHLNSFYVFSYYPKCYKERERTGILGNK